MMDQILLRRSDEHTPWLSAERIPSRLSDACAEACNIALERISLMTTPVPLSGCGSLIDDHRSDGDREGNVH